MLVTADRLPSITEIELRVLRALCADDFDPSQWVEIQRQLSTHTWRDPDHAVVYQAIVKARARDPHNWRRQLPAQATLMGFPELDWSTFLVLSGRAASEADLRDLIRELVEAAARG